MNTSRVAGATVTRQVLATLAIALAVMAGLLAIGIAGLANVTSTKSRVIERDSRLVIDAHRLDVTAAERSVAARNHLLTGDEGYLDAFNEADGEFDRIMAALRAQVHTADAARLLAEIERRDRALDTEVEDLTDARDAGTLGGEALATAIRDRLTPTRRELKEAISQLIDREEANIARAVAESDATARRTIWILVVAGLASILGTLAVGSSVTRNVSRRLTRLAHNVDSAATDILSGTTQHAAGASAQAAAVQETVATTDELARTAEQSAERARAVAERAQRASEVARAGTSAGRESAGAMERIRQQVDSIASTVVALAERTQAVSDIVRSVDDIAEQIHLLALNAAIEAARAGDHGRGFAVVAGEVRALADESKRATLQIADILGEIQHGTNTAVMATEQGAKSVVDGVQQIKVTASTVDDLAETVAASAVAAEQISASSGQQAVATVQISQAMRDLDEVAQQNAAAARQAEEAARILNEVALDLKAIVGAGRAS